MKMLNFKMDLDKFSLNSITNKHLFVGFICLFLVIFCYDFLKNREEITPAIDMSTVDTLIPNGMTLVPIEIQNSNALSELIGQFGVIDLYVSPLDPSLKPKKVASQIKIMRAPLNPNIYAVLVREDQAIFIAKHTGQFFVTVLNPKSKNFQMEKQRPRKTFKITTEI